LQRRSAGVLPLPEGLALKEVVNAGGEAGEIELRILRNEPTEEG
jgi:hypothetical protein